METVPKQSEGNFRVLYENMPLSEIWKERLTHTMFESFFHHSADAMAVFDLEGRVVQANEAFEKMFGWTRQEVVGQKLPTIPQNRIHEMEEIYEEVKGGGEVIGLETVRQHKDGHLVVVSVTYSPIRDAKGNVVAVSGIARDITDLKKAEELLRKSDRLSMAGQLAAGIAHEIRNPLTVLKGFVQLLQSNIDPEYYRIMLSELDRINLIASELLMLAKPQLTHLQNEDLRILLRDGIVLLNPQAILNHVQIVTEFDSDIPFVTCEANQLKQVFINLLQNAIDAMPRGGDLVIQVKRQDPDHILIRFRDQGEGIPEERLSRLGEPFYTTKEKGTGLGLMVSFKIIKNHGGSIQVQSQVGQGTTVDVVLPVSPDTANGHPS